MQILIALAIWLISELLRPLPKTRNAEAVPFEEARLPSIDPEATIPVGWGRVRWTAPHLMGMISYTTVAIEQEVKTLFKSKEVTVGFRYFVTMYMGLGTGEQNIHQIFYDTKLLWDRTADGFTSQSATAGDLITIAKPKFLGGKLNGGSMNGKIRFYRGRADQVADPVIALTHTPTPAYRFTSYVLLDTFEIGESPDISSFEFVCDRQPVDVLGLGANLRIAGDAAGTEVNPMAVAAELLTSKNFGEAAATSELNIATLKSMGDVLATEGNGMSLKWVSEETVARVLQMVQEQIQGVIFKKIGTGLWSGRLMRADYTVGALKTLDLSNIKEMRNYSRRSWPETINVAIAEYQDRDITRKPTPAVENDYASFQRLGRTRTERRQYPGVYSGALATQLAVRMLRTLSFPFASGELSTDRTMYDVEPTEPVKLVYSPLGITQLIVRVTSIGYGTSSDPTMTLSFVEDAFGNTFASFAPPQTDLTSPINSAPVVIATWLPYEMPYYLQVQDPTATLPSNKIAIVALSPQSNALNFRIYQESPAGGSIKPEIEGVFVPSGTLQSALVEETADVGVTGVVIQNLSLPVRILEDGFASDTNIRGAFGGIALIENGSALVQEMIGVQSITDLGNGTHSLTIVRGLCDTLPKLWPIGSRVWFLSASINTTANAFNVADVISTQLLTRTSQGESANTASKDVTLGSGPTNAANGRSIRPYNPVGFKIGAARYPLFALQNGAATIVVSWQHQNRLLNSATFQDGTGGTIEPNTEYLLNVYNAAVGGTKIRSAGRTAAGATTNDTTPLTSTGYNYTNAFAIADGGPFPVLRFELISLGDGLGSKPTTLVSWENIVRVVYVYVVTQDQFRLKRFQRANWKDFPDAEPFIKPRKSTVHYLL